MIFNTDTTQYDQIGIVAGGVNPNDCGSSNFPGVYTRLDHQEIWSFIQTIVPYHDKINTNVLKQYLEFIFYNKVKIKAKDIIIHLPCRFQFQVADSEEIAEIQ